MGLARGAIQREARGLLERLWREREAQLGRRPANEFFPVDVEALVSLLSWRLEEVAVAAYSQDHTENVQGYCDSSSRTIYLSVDTIRTPEHRRFTIAHEIGHAILHGGSPQPHYRLFPPKSRTWSQPAKPPEEAEANAFAAELLMPERTVRQRFRDSYGVSELWAGSDAAKEIANLGPWETPRLRDVARHVASHDPTGPGSSLSAYFGVSPTAMGRRIEVLRLVYL